MRRITENDQERQHPLLVIFEQNRTHDRFIQYQRIGNMVSKDTFDLSKMTSYMSKNNYQQI